MERHSSSSPLPVSVFAVAVASSLALFARKRRLAAQSKEPGVGVEESTRALPIIPAADRVCSRWTYTNEGMVNLVFSYTGMAATSGRASYCTEKLARFRPMPPVLPRAFSGPNPKLQRHVLRVAKDVKEAAALERRDESAGCEAAFRRRLGREHVPKCWEEKASTLGPPPRPDAHAHATRLTRTRRPAGAGPHLYPPPPPRAPPNTHTHTHTHTQQPKTALNAPLCRVRTSMWLAPTARPPCGLGFGPRAGPARVPRGASRLRCHRGAPCETPQA